MTRTSVAEETLIQAASGSNDPSSCNKIRAEIYVYQRKTIESNVKIEKQKTKHRVKRNRLSRIYGPWRAEFIVH